MLRETTPRCSFFLLLLFFFSSPQKNDRSTRNFWKLFMEGNSFGRAEGDGALRVEKRRINAFRYPKIWWVFFFWFFLAAFDLPLGRIPPYQQIKENFFILLGALAWPLFFFIKIPFAVIPGEVSQPSLSAWWNRQEKFRVCWVFLMFWMCWRGNVPGMFPPPTPRRPSEVATS